MDYIYQIFTCWQNIQLYILYNALIKTSYKILYGISRGLPSSDQEQQQQQIPKKALGASVPVHVQT